MKKKVLFICKKGFTYGYDGCIVTKKSGLFNSTQFIADAIGADFIEVVDNNDIDRWVTFYKPDLVIIEALWVIPEKFKVLKKLHPKVKWYVRIHSDIPFLAYEGIAMEWIEKYLGNGIGVIVNNLNAKKALQYAFGWEITYLPNIYPEFDSPMPHWPHEALHVGCFGALRPMKNQLEQAMAALKFAALKKKYLRFHINGTRVETSGQPVLKNLRSLLGHHLVEHKWHGRKDFLLLLSHMDIGMQVSMTETFNIVTADMVSVGIPVVVSKQIPWVAGACQADLLVDDIIKKMGKVYGNKCLIRKNKKLLKAYSKASLKLWLKFICHE